MTAVEEHQGCWWLGVMAAWVLAKLQQEGGRRRGATGREMSWGGSDGSKQLKQGGGRQLLATGFSLLHQIHGMNGKKRNEKGVVCVVVLVSF